MKKFISLIICVLALTFANAQSTSPRFGTGVRDNTGRVLTYNVTSYAADAAGNDTIFLTPDAYVTHLRSTVNITDSVNIKPKLTRCNFGDVLKVFVTKGSGSGAVRFPSTLFTNDASANRYTIGANKTAYFEFIFNGSKWVMTAKMIQP